jgi:hypothetical protein
MKIWIEDGLPYTAAVLTHQGTEQRLQRVLIDTGSGGTVFSVDTLLSLGVRYEMDDVIHRIRGIGGAEFVFSKTIDRIAIENLVLHNFDVEVGVMDYGVTLDGIIGMDFLLQVGAVIDLAQLRIFHA